ncbi:hypothetical protein ASE00_15190 [Sphingomonas sp. Root710]|uniref:hypothetical protein n=1 Tax=Sphingomonas sp. Root710 TaxID=1736594 RepID=UPI0006F9F7C7|nr:hypothetical protein [Sphingomonas sp. Root710]KRB81331.1 hypothetical protein ASE00_15190 [Sphingomonas sp. Root710]
MKGLLAGLLLLSAVANASVQKDFLRACEERVEQYSAQRVNAENRTQQSAARAVASINAADPSAGQALSTALGDTRQLSTLYGRYEMLSQLQQFMQKKPTPAATDAWMQSRVEELRTKIATADAAESGIRQSTPGKDIGLLAWVGAVERLAQDRGKIEGAAAELRLIERDLQSYHAARAEEHARAVQVRSAILIGIVAALAYQQETTHDIGVGAFSPNVHLCPDGSYVGGSGCVMTPEGNYVGGTPMLTPNGDFVGGTPQMAPNGRYIGGSGKPVRCPDGSYVAGACHMTPKGNYVGE